MIKVKELTKLMLIRRGYVNFEDKKPPAGSKINPDIMLASSSPCYEKNKNLKETLVVFFVNKTNCGSEKITIKLFGQLITMEKPINHIIIIHSYKMPLTCEVTQNLLRLKNCDDQSFCEFFTTDDLKFDLFKVLFKNIDDSDNIKFVPKIYDKIPYILGNDPLSKYMGARPGDCLSGKFEGTDEISDRRCIAEKHFR
jgi:hypothetical protein